MISAKAFAPANISCIFVIKKTKNPSKSGSLGLGFTVDKGVIVTIKKNTTNNTIYFNNKKINLPTVKTVIEKLTDEKVVINIKSNLPLGCGFGISGACAIASSYALNKLLNLGKSKINLAFIAHISEIENGTGLGDVVNQFFGGFLIKYEPSYKFKVKKLPINNKKIYYKYFSSIETKKIISNIKIKNDINISGLVSLNKIKKLKNKSLKNLIKISKEFSVKSSLLQNKKIIEIIRKIEIKNGNASMIMLGNAVFSNIFFKESKELIIKDKGACLL